MTRCPMMRLAGLLACLPQSSTRSPLCPLRHQATIFMRACTAERPTHSAHSFILSSQSRASSPQSSSHCESFGYLVRYYIRRLHYLSPHCHGRVRHKLGRPCHVMTLEKHRQVSPFSRFRNAVKLVVLPDADLRRTKIHSSRNGRQRYGNTS